MVRLFLPLAKQTTPPFDAPVAPPPRTRLPRVCGRFLFPRFLLAWDSENRTARARFLLVSDYTARDARMCEKKLRLERVRERDREKRRKYVTCVRACARACYLYVAGRLRTKTDPLCVCARPIVRADQFSHLRATRTVSGYTRVPRRVCGASVPGIGSARAFVAYYYSTYRCAIALRAPRCC